MTASSSFSGAGFAALALTLGSAVVSCSADRVAGPAPASMPPSLERAVKESGIENGTFLAIQLLDDPSEERPKTGLIAAQTTNLELAFTVHPNGGRRDDLRQREILNGDPTQLVGFFAICVVSGFGFQAEQWRMDSLLAKNFQTASGGHSPGHDYSDTDVGRPRGVYTPTNGAVDDFLFITEYTSNIAAGEEKVETHYTITDPNLPPSCIGPGMDEFSVLVEVPGLVPIIPGSDVALAPPSSHDAAGFWFVNSATIGSTERLAQWHFDSLGVPLLLTAASLIQGGINDISRNWAPTPLGHWEHRVGTDVDIDEQANNDPDRLNAIARTGVLKGFQECEPHPRTNPNHVHCRQSRYQ